MDSEVVINNEPIYAALAVYDPKGTYSQHAGVTITSIFENTKSKVIVYILHDETLTEENKKKFRRTAEKYNQTIELKDVSSFKEQLSAKIKDFVEGQETIGALYRLSMPDVLPNISKVVYCDCDVVFDLDIKELWDIDVKDYCMAGVHDISAVGAAEFVRDLLIGCSSRTYVNSGVVVMNLNMIRGRGNLFQNAMTWLNSHFHLMRHSDQDIINCLFYKSIKLIDQKFNTISPVQKDEIRDRIIHAAGFVKAWEITGLPYQKLYWEMYLKSAWGENISNSELIDLISSLYVGRKDKWQILFERIQPVLQKIYWFFNAVRYVLKDICFRIKYKLKH